jgi:hypothetical protein
MIKLLLPHLLIGFIVRKFRRRKIDALILELRKEIAFTRANTDLSDEMRTKLIMDLFRQIHLLEERADAL